MIPTYENAIKQVVRVASVIARVSWCRSDDKRTMAQSFETTLTEETLKETLENAIRPSQNSTLSEKDQSLLLTLLRDWEKLKVDLSLTSQRDTQQFSLNDDIRNSTKNYTYEYVLSLIFEDHARRFNVRNS